MDLIPKDVIAIVYRYIYDYYYTQVKQKYRLVWLNGYENQEHNIFWDHKYSEFSTNDRHVANWRHLPLKDKDEHDEHSVSTFYEFRNSRICLAENY